MTVLDIGNNVAVNNQILASRYAASVSTPTALDLQGVTWAFIHFDVGSKTGSTSIYTYTVEDSPDNVTFSTVKKWTDGEVSTDDAEIVIAADGTGQETTYHVAVEAGHLDRYMRVTCVLSGGGADTIDTAVCVITMPNYTGDSDTPDFSI